MVLFVNRTNTYISGGDTIRVTLDDTFEVVDNCEVRLGLSTDAYSTQPLAVDQDVYFASAGSGSSLVDRTFIDFFVRESNDGVYGSAAPITTMMRDVKSYLHVVCSNLINPPHASANIKGRVEIIAYELSPTGDVKTEALRSSRDFSSLLTVVPAVMATVKATSSTTYTNSKAKLTITLPKTKIVIPSGGALEIYFPNSWHETEGDEDEGWVPNTPRGEDMEGEEGEVPPTSELVFNCEVTKFYDATVEVETVLRDREMFKRIRAVFGSQVEVGKDISVVCAGVQTPKTPEPKSDTLYVQTMDDRERLLEINEKGTIVAITDPPIPMVRSGIYVHLLSRAFTCFHVLLYIFIHNYDFFFGAFPTITPYLLYDHPSPPLTVKRYRLHALETNYSL